MRTANHWAGRACAADTAPVTVAPTHPARTVCVLIGLQASGKSTFALTLTGGAAVVVSKDAFPNARRRQARQLRMIASALADGQDVVVDNTNPSAAEWTPILTVARAHGAKTVAYYFPPDPSGSRARNAARTGRARVPDVGLFDTLRRLRRPGPADGFDQIVTVELDGAGGFLTRTNEA